MNLALPELLLLPHTTDHDAKLRELCPIDQECIWVNPADEKLSIELVRQLQDKLQYLPVTSQRIVVITHLETASLPAQQALLKLLEEPPARTQIYLTCTNLGQVLATIQSRCLLRAETSANNEERRLKGEALYHQLASHHIPDILALSSEIKDRAAAENACQDLLWYIHPLATSPRHDQTQAVAQCLLILKSLDLLANNVSPRLVLEDMWLQW